METLRIEISETAYGELCKQAEISGKALETLSREILEEALHGHPSAPLTVRDIRQQAGLLTELSPDLRARIIPGVTLDEVRESLTSAGGPPLSEIIQQQRGPKG